MKAQPVPVYFQTAEAPSFVAQTDPLPVLLADHAELLAPVHLGAALPDADAVIFPELVGDAYRQEGRVRALPLPILVVTSEFGPRRYLDNAF